MDLICISFIGSSFKGCVLEWCSLYWRRDRHCLVGIARYCMLCRYEFSRIIASNHDDQAIVAYVSLSPTFYHRLNAPFLFLFGLLNSHETYRTVYWHRMPSQISHLPIKVENFNVTIIIILGQTRRIGRCVRRFVSVCFCLHEYGGI